MIPDPASLFGRHEFIVRRVHSLLGLIPVGMFLIIHLATNVTILDGPKTFQARVDQIHSLGPSTLLMVEWGFIFLPILLHGVVGLAIVARGHRNLLNYPYAGNFRYTIQRWSGVIAFVFIVWHVFHTRGWFLNEWWMANVTQRLGGGTFKADDAARTTVAALQAARWIAVAYAVGTVASVYHLANGVWTMGITWGLWTSPHAQRWATGLCAVVGMALLVVGLAALVGLEIMPAG
ncbi:MAG: succinate dehydrogenase cytochrome b558 subunit [Thermoguttaceae bacterium]|jgi:succinate dehydrogenase / fumarate reductase cytochrome b subunit